MAVNSVLPSRGGSVKLQPWMEELWAAEQPHQLLRRPIEASFRGSRRGIGSHRDAGSAVATGFQWNAVFSRTRLVAAGAAVGFGLAGCHCLVRPRRILVATRAAAEDKEGEEDDDEEKAKSKLDEEFFIEANYLPPLQSLPSEEAPEASYVLPLFPLGETVYLPETSVQLVIFEPRYRKMYNDMIATGKRRCVVQPLMPTKDGDIRLLKVGVVFYLKDLEDLSDKTGDQYKYQCQHDLIGRVRIKKILNPEVFRPASTYLEAEVEDLVDIDAEEDLEAEETELYELLEELLKVQAELKEKGWLRDDPRKKGDNTGRQNVWLLTNDWMEWNRAQWEMTLRAYEQELQNAITSYYLERGEQVPERIVLDSTVAKGLMPAVMRFTEQRLEAMERLRSKMKFLVRLFLSDSHKERLSMLKATVAEELKLSRAKLALKDALTK